MATEEKQSGPRIVVAYQNYKPPFDSEKVICNMLSVVPANYLRGLHSVVLTNVQALPHKSRVRKGSGRRRVPLSEALGYYTQAWKGEPTRVTLLIDNLEKRWGRAWLRFGIIRDIIVAEVLYHELGHHIHRLHIPEFEGSENVAEKWSKKLRVKFLRVHYWYLIPVISPLAKLYRWYKPTKGAGKPRPNS
jgi:hypothetical protein